MIDEVVGICVELEPSSLIDGKSFLEGEIPVLETRAIDAVADAPLQIECACCWLGKDRGTIRVGCREVLVTLLSGIPRKLLEDLRSSVHDPELALGGVGTATETADLANARVIVVGSDAAGLACLKLRTTTKLPATNELSSYGALVPEERQGIEVIDDCHIASVVLRGTPEVRRVISVGHDVAIIRTVVHAPRPSVADAEHEVIGKAAAPTGLHGVISCAAVALLLLNGGEAKIRTEIVHVLPWVGLQGADGGLIDVKHTPVMVATTADVCDGERRAQWKFTLERSIP